MMLFVFSILCAFVQVTCLNPRSHWTLLPHILVLNVDGTLGQYPLSCLEEDPLKRDNHTQEIFWRRNGVEEAQRGNTHMVQLVESFGGGNYTCHREDGTLLNHTEVLIMQDESKRRRILVKTEQEYLKCSTQNYNGEFHCSWTWHSSRVSKIAFIKAQRGSGDNNTQCSVDASDQHWMCTSAHRNFSCSVDGSRSGVSCRDKQHCPFAEEKQPIHMTVYVRTDHFLLESYSKLFLLSEIVKPDKVRIGKVNTTVVEWSYPSSWSTPYSYFPLTFQIFQVRGRCRKCENPCAGSKPPKALTIHSTDICQFKVKHKVKAVCVRAKDALCDSEWSEWSHVRLRRNGKSKKYKQHKKYA